MPFLPHILVSAFLTKAQLIQIDTGNPHFIFAGTKT